MNLPYKNKLNLEVQYSFSRKSDDVESKLTRYVNSDFHSPLENTIFHNLSVSAPFIQGGSFVITESTVDNIDKIIDALMFARTQVRSFWLEMDMK